MEHMAQTGIGSQSLVAFVIQSGYPKYHQKSSFSLTQGIAFQAIIS
jgi:hypothetical protein